ncbi:MAG: phosphate signaling complex protein PhoU [Pseudohongiellaceae bacterium]
MNQQVEGHKHHISRQYNAELEDVKNRMLEMGGFIEKQFNDALDSLMRADSAMAQRVRHDDDEINAMEIAIDEECSRILARRQPAASDLRLVLAIIKTIRDLERIGDESSKIAKMAIKLSEEGESPKGYMEIRHIGERVGRMIHGILDAFARYDIEAAWSVAQEDAKVDLDYRSAMRETATYMMEDPRSITRVLNIMWALRALERIGDHVKNISEHVIYVVKGTDIRQQGVDRTLEDLEEN